MRNSKTTLVIFIVLQFFVLAANGENYKEVLEMNPVGYWPADEGSGPALYDRAGKNHGRLHFLGWRDGFLDFDCDTYQWVQVPFKKEYGSKTFSMGGWVYSTLDQRIPTPQDDSFHFGALLIGQPFVPQSGSKYKWAVWGARLETDGAMLRYGLPDDKGLSPVEVVSGQKSDVVGSVKENTGIESGKWQHLFYTYDQNGTGRLYINGKLAASQNNIDYKPADTPLVIGGGRWGTWNLGGTLSFDGSLRHIAFFDRTLDASEIAKLCYLTEPDVQPALEDKTSKQQKSYSIDELIERVQNQELDNYSRGQVALELGQKGTDASKAIKVLADELRKQTERNGTHLPRIEEFFTNAIIRTLLDIDPQDDVAKNILSEAFAKPLFDKFDTSLPGMEKCRTLIDRGRAMDAVTILKEHMATLPPLPKLEGWGSSQRAGQLDEICSYLPLKQGYYNKYLSKGLPFADAHYNAYNQIDTWKDFTYTTVVERVPYEEVISEFEKELKDRTDQVPEREHNDDSTAERCVKLNRVSADEKYRNMWSRVKIIRIAPDGSRQEAYLGGKWFIFKANDEKMDGWAVVVDQDGYIHLLGGQHNQPDQDNYIPGSWERWGIAEGENRPQVMYWVSKQPGDITDFGFAGQKNNPRSLTGWMNYMNFAKSREDELFIYGRGQMWTWAMLHYDQDSRRWTQITGSASDMLKRAQRENPDWVAGLGDTVPYYGPADGLVSAWQPGAYNFCRQFSGHVRGVSFDLSGRMHLEMQILGVGEDGKMTEGPVYAYSDDLGETFHRADGKELKLPLTVNPIPSHNADINSSNCRQYYDLWISLIKEFGCD